MEHFESEHMGPEKESSKIYLRDVNKTYGVNAVKDTAGFAMNQIKY